MDTSDKMCIFLTCLIFVCILCGLSAGYPHCGGVYTGSQFTIESPNYPDSFRGDTTCEFILKDEKCSTEFIFYFVDFDFENTLNCNSSRLEIEQQGILCGKHSGTKVYYSQYGILKVTFYAQQQNSAKFKLMVSKVPCNSDRITKRRKRTIFQSSCKSYEIPSPFLTYSHYYHNPVHLPLITQQTTADTFCCAERYDSKNFIITSPNFPHAKSAPKNCVYHIYRANKNVCRLRFNFSFYWNGLQTEYGCQNGYIEIDGQYVCGCRTGLKLETNFDRLYGDSPKVIKYHSGGYPSEKFTGFAIEVVQDECPERYTSHQFETTKTKWNPFHGGQICWNPPCHAENNGSDKGDTSYIDISTFNPFLHSIGFNDHLCRVWGVVQKGLLEKNVLGKKIPHCTNGQSNKCIEIRQTSGCLKSPGYPFYYPNNLNLCYRFIKSPGYCSVKLVMLDFLIQNSPHCSSDYVLLGNKKKFCGSGLYNTYSQLNFLNGTFEDLLFVTDSSISCRGFKAWFEQTRCKYITTAKPFTTTTTKPIPTITSAWTTPPVTSEHTTTPQPTTTIQSTTTPQPTTTIQSTTTSYITTSTVPSTTFPITTTMLPEPTTIETTTRITTTEASPQECHREYRGISVYIEYYEYEGNTCRFTVHKYDPDVCLLNLRVIGFNFPCDKEYLIVSGNRLCQPLEFTNLDFYDDNITILYYREGLSGNSNSRIRIYGEQSTDCIPDPEVNPEKLKEYGDDNDEDKEGQYETAINKNEFGNYSAIIRNLNPEMCGLVIKVPWYAEQNYPISFNMCNLLKHYEDRKACIPLEDYSFYALYADDKIELFVKSTEQFRTMRFKEVRCIDKDNRNVLDSSDLN